MNETAWLIAQWSVGVAGTFMVLTALLGKRLDYVVVAVLIVIAGLSLLLYL